MDKNTNVDTQRIPSEERALALLRDDSADDRSDSNLTHGGLAPLRLRAAGIISGFAAAGAAAVAVPLPVRDAVLLSPLELAEINALADVYGITKDESIRRGFSALIELGAVSTVGRKALGFLERKPLPGVAKRATNAITAAGVVTGIGICSAYSFEQMHLGRASVEDFGVFRTFSSSAAWQDIKSGIADTLQQSIRKGNFNGLQLSIADLLETLFPRSA